MSEMKVCPNKFWPFEEHHFGQMAVDGDSDVRHMFSVTEKPFTYQSVCANYLQLFSTTKVWLFSEIRPAPDTNLFIVRGMRTFDCFWPVGAVPPINHVSLMPLLCDAMRYNDNVFEH